MTQNERLADYLKKYGKITRRQAMRELEIMELSARIGELESRHGYKIVKTPTRTPNGKRVTVYSLPVMP